ncbi:MAG TPA: hypothetical protein VKB75_03335 [Jatrophihabitans sp.]|nr:hypothetical protein [Jatrophihabitans sp.]
MRMRALLVVAALVVAGAAALVWRSTTASSTHETAPKATPVLLVHGYAKGACPGTDVLHAIWGGVYLMLQQAGWTGPVLPMSYYRCDTDGVDFTGYGPITPQGATPTITAAQTRGGYDQDVSLDQLAHDLAWFVYNTYSRHDTPVDLVGSSMGGLIMRDALYRVAARDRSFPPYLLVPRAVTFSTPHGGYGQVGANSDFCGGQTVECDQFAIGSPFMTMLADHAQDPQARGGTAWMLVGSSAGCDFVPARSSLAMPAAQRVDYLSPCYGHIGYLWDLQSSQTARALVTAPGRAPVANNAAPRPMVLLGEVLSAR